MEHSSEVDKDIKDIKSIKKRKKSSLDSVYMNAKLIKFLASKKNIGGVYNFTSQIHPIGSYKIDRKDMEEFWNLYCDLISTKDNETVTGLAQTPSDYIPILVDVDIKIKLESFNIAQNLKPEYEKDIKLTDPSHTIPQIYTQKDIETVVGVYQDVLRETLESIEDYELTCFVLTKPHPYIESDKICSGFHLHFIYIFMHKSDQEVHIITRVRKRVSTLIEEKKLFVD